MLPGPLFGAPACLALLILVHMRDLGLLHRMKCISESS
jgi:hypothetical protein